MVGWSEIVDWTPDRLEVAYDSFRRDEAQVQAAGDQLYRSSSEIRNEGHSADSARSKLGQLRAESDEIEGLISDLLSATRVAATEVGQIAGGVKEAQAFAAASHLMISPTGSVSLQPIVETIARSELIQMLGPAAGALAPIITAPSYIQALMHKAQLEGQIATLITQANRADFNYASALHAIADGRVSHASSAASAGSSKEGLDKGLMMSTLRQRENLSEVRALWDSLSYEQQQELIAAFPEEVGSMRGIPFEARVQANDLNIDREVGERQDRLREVEEKKKQLERNWSFGKKDDIERYDKEIEQLQKEIDFYNSMKTSNGGAGAILFDPDNNRLITAQGDMRKSAGEVVTFVPGTTTTKLKMENYSDLTGYLVDQGNTLGTNTVAFGFFDGRFDHFDPLVGEDDQWISWDGAHSNANPFHLRQLGANLAEFQEELALEEFSRDADNNVIGHSAGHSVATASEIASKTRSGVPDAHYDGVHSLSGSYAPPGWERHYSTEYDHYAYGRDPIHLLDKLPGVDTPRESHIWDNHIHGTSETEKGFTLHPVDIHGRSASGNTHDNLPILQDLKHEIFKD